MANMDTILVVSPGYLDAVKSCISRYTNFCIAGYSEPARAIEALMSIPGKDFLGFAYINDSLPVNDKELDDLLLLVNKANIVFQDIVDQNKVETKIPFLFLMSTKIGGATAGSNYLRSLLENVGTHNLSIGYYNYDMMTDIVIKIQMFGTILLRRRPFEVARPQIAETFNNPNRLSLSLPFEQKFIAVYEPLTFAEVDEFFDTYANDRVLCLIRTYMYNGSEQLLTEIKRQMENMSFVERIPYEAVLRNMNLVKAVKV